MAKKKINVRKDYSYEAKKRLPAYKTAKVQRKIQFLVLRGPGLDQDETVEQNEILKKFATLKHRKLKFVQIKTLEEAVSTIKESNTWAGGVVFLQSDIVDTGGVIQKAIKSLLIKTVQVETNDECKAALAELIKSQVE